MSSSPKRNELNRPSWTKVPLIKPFVDLLAGGCYLNPEDAGDPTYSPLSRVYAEVAGILALLAVCFASGLAMKGWRVISEPQVVAPSHLDSILFTLLLGAIACEIVYKILERKVIFLTQPCYMAMILYCIILRSPDTVLAQRCFCVAFASIYGHIGALLMPPDHKAAGRNRFDILMYDIGHYMLVLLPSYMLVVRGFGSLFTQDVATFCATFCLSRCYDAFYHFCVLLPLGLVFRINFNCMISPLESFPTIMRGPNYRMVVYGLSWFFSLLFTTIYLGAACGMSCAVSRFV